MFADWVNGRRQPDRDAARHAARGPARPDRRRQHARRRLPDGRHRAPRPGAGHRRPDDAVPRHRRPLHARRRDDDRHARTRTRPRRRRTRRSPCAASARTAARPPRSPTTWRARSSTRARATRPGPDRSATAVAADPLRRPVLRPPGLQPDWVDLNKVAIPQADEQQRLLANLILHDERRPQAAAALLVLPARREGGRRDDRRRPRQRRHRGPLRPATRRSPAGCSVADWECVRGDLVHLSRARRSRDAQAAGLPGAGLRDRAARRTPAAPTGRRLARANFYDDQLAELRAELPERRRRRRPTARTASRGATSDRSRRSSSTTASGSTRTTTTGRAAWVQDRPGHVHRLGHADALRRPRRHDDRRLPGDDADDRRVGPVVPVHDRHAARPARSGAEGYYGAFTANMHTDRPARRVARDRRLGAGARRAVVSARQMLTWLDGRNGSSFSGPRLERRDADVHDRRRRRARTACRRCCRPSRRPAR